MIVGGADGRDPGANEGPGRIERQVEESELMLAHARAFLDALGEGESGSEDYLRKLTEDMERNLDRLRRRKDGQE